MVGPWTSPRVINDTPSDDRDSGVISLGGTDSLLVTWFSVDARGATPSDYEDGVESAGRRAVVAGA